MVNNFVSEFVAREIQGLGNPWAYLFYAVMVGLTVIIFAVIYMTQGAEYFKRDGILSQFERSFVKKLFVYWLWAFVQQSIVFSVLYCIHLHDDWLYVIGVIFFAVVFHLPNLRLMAFTFCFASLFYYGYFFAGFTSLIMLAFAHAVGGTLYYLTGQDMRVWRFR